MPLTAEQIYNEAVQLPNEAKIFLVEKLMENIDIDRDTEALQIREAKKRRDEIRSGRVQPVPGEKALKKVSPRPFGLCTEEFSVPDDFDDPLPEYLLNEFEGK
ncbi:MAG: addiction module protein [Desulfobacterales bacterium]|nr:addiction module protein [Desulfobacterales bacterium]